MLKAEHMVDTHSTSSRRCARLPLQNETWVWHIVLQAQHSKDKKDETSDQKSPFFQAQGGALVPWARGPIGALARISTL